MRFIKIGIHSVSSQSGRSYLVDFLESGHKVYGYARESDHGKRFVDTINNQGGIFLERPENFNMKAPKLIELGNDSVGHDLSKLAEDADLIVIAHPSHYLPTTIQQLKDAGIVENQIPIILTPPRTFAVPYLWKILGEGYPFVSFSTCPYSCKAIGDGGVFIKRRKRSWLVSLEGRFNKKQIQALEELFPQALYNHIPATTSVGNIGAVFHPGPYLLNYEDIVKAQKENREYSFYMEGIARNEKAAAHLELVDQIRLEIASKLGLNVFGLKSAPNEERWKHIMDHLREKEIEANYDIEELRHIRHDYLREINDSITSAQHWLDYTYGVSRIPGESLQLAIGRTPTYQKRSVPQIRYIEEDVPTGLIPMKAIGERLNIDITPIDELIELYNKYFPDYEPSDWRDLKDFSTDYIIDYLTGKFFEIVD